MRSQLSFQPHPFIRPPSRSRVYLCPFRGFWQEVGRCARKYCYKGKTILYLVRIEKDNKLGQILKAYYKDPMCFRRLILSQFVISGIYLSAIKGSTPEICNLKCSCKMCLCCTYCKSQCPCILLLLKVLEYQC